MESVRKYTEGNIGVLCLNRPKQKNTFDEEFADQLNDGLYQFDREKSVKVILIESEGKHFSTGISLDEFYERNPERLKDLLKKMDAHNHTIARLSKPVISVTSGYTVANGAGLAFASDLVVSSTDAVFGTTAIKVGLACLGPAIPLSRHIGRKKLMQMLMTGVVLSAIEAYDMGLVNWLVEPGELKKKSREIATQIASKNPHALKTIKEVVYRASEMPYHQALDLATDLFTQLSLNDSAIKGIESFRNKEKPNWD